MAQYTGKRDDEFFAGNVDEGIPSYLSQLHTVRLGDAALDIDGKRLPHYRPMFVGSREAGAYDAIMMARFRATEPKVSAALTGATP